jgi:3-deoxy-manno-octulosonate cytidylyltransferase (CMP-KDO synthetase)
VSVSRHDVLARARLLACDVDGVLTDGKLAYTGDGEGAKVFHVRDGQGLRALLDHGLPVVWITARGGAAVRRRAEELGITQLVEGASDKLAAVSAIAAARGVALVDVVYVGDDVIDVAAMRAVGLAVAPADAHASARAVAGWVTRARGGRGAVRELADAILAARADAAPRFRVVIPARMGSTRLPGKPMRLLGGEPMVVQVWRRALAAGATEVVVAHDDARIGAAIAAVGGDHVLTRADHASGTDRIAEVAETRGWPDDELIVNLQGDEPGMPASAITAVARLLARRPEASLATLATPIHRGAELRAPSVVKLVLDDADLACVFSRAPIPWVRDAFAGGVPDELPTGVRFLRHLGLYAYRAGALRQLCRLAPHPWELAESLEQLRALAAGMKIAALVLPDAPAHGVDTEDDLARMEQALGRGAGDAG